MIGTSLPCRSGDYSRPFAMTTLELVLLLLCASVLVLTAFRALALPPILGYLLVGATVGPHALNLLPDTEGPRHLAEFGVVLLMFTIGLEFSLPRLYAMKRIVFGLGGLQVLGTMLGVALAARLFGVPWLHGLALGGALAMSSTAILSKLLSERRELDAPHGQQVIGVLLFQDLAVVPLLVAIPALSQPVEQLAGALALAALKAALLLAAVLFFGRKLLAAWFHVIARRKSGELFMLNVLLVTLGLGWLTEQAGLSLALGAFVAGMLIAETEYRYPVEEDIKPFRDVLLGLFFISIGMMLDVPAIVRDWAKVLLLLVLLLGGKLLVAAAAARLFSKGMGHALRTGLWLCAAGEFGFVLLALAVQVGLLQHPLLQPLLAAMVLSLLVAPLIAQFAEAIVLRLVPNEWLARSLQLTEIARQAVSDERRVLLLGYGRTGQHLARWLEAERIGYLAIDYDPERVRAAAAAGEPVVWGDATRSETLTAAGVQRARVVILTWSDAALTLHALHRLRALRTDLPVVVRAREQDDAERLYAAGATEVVPEALESSVMLATHALALLGMPMHRIVKRLRELRERHYEMLRGFFHGASDAGDALGEAELPRLKAVTLVPGAFAIGHTLAELDLPALGARVSALRRAHQPRLAVSMELTLQESDIVVLLGDDAALLRAEDYLLRG